MSHIGVGLAVFAWLAAMAIGTMLLYPKLPARHRDQPTNDVVRLVVNLFVVMTSLVFGLMLNSAKNTFETIDTSLHTYGASLIMLDQTLRIYGAGAEEARHRLEDYVEAAIASPARADDPLHHEENSAAWHFDRLRLALAAIPGDGGPGDAALTDARAQYRHLVEQRWLIIEKSEGVIPSPLIGMLIAWLTLIFASFGYRAPANRVLVGLFVVAAALNAAAIYLILDMDIPFSGPIQITDAPLRRALAAIQM
ncbi:hypothetical protein [Zavarzinia sp. CC-PAN008]|uniref:bestrophin-like domain n=1 Tax=Zavarzinia sp. CC-PAN008 TaxID=3243332 RepID=UPI003F74514B